MAWILGIVARFGWRRIATAGAGVVIVLALLLAVRGCDRQADKAVEQATEHGRVIERAAATGEVVKDAETVAKIDAGLRAGTVHDRMRQDPHCRDC